VGRKGGNYTRHDHIAAKVLGKTRVKKKVRAPEPSGKNYKRGKSGHK